MTVRTEIVDGFLLLREITLQKSLGLVGNYRILPILLWTNLLTGEDFHHVTTMQLSLHRCKLSVDSCIVGMFTQFAVNLKGEVECSCLLWQIDSHTLWREYHDVIVVERGGDILNETAIFQVEFHIPQYFTESVNPLANVTFLTLGNNAYLIVSNHPLAGEMDFLPTAIV